MKKAFIIGINGKMGRMLCDVASDYGYEIVGGFDLSAHDGDIPVFSDAEKVDVKYDVIIDFSRPAPETFSAIERLSHGDIPVVIATTGFCDEGLKRIDALSKKVPVFKSANMSIGIAAVKAAAKLVKTILGDGFDIEIVEKHHNQKIDSPSGTALLLADALCDKDKQTVARSGKRTFGEIGIASVRGGTVVGEHEVGFYGVDEIVTLSHSARSRALFAAGAFKAADFIRDKAPGLYDMDDLVNSLS